MIEESKRYKRIGEKLINKRSEFEYIKDNDVRIAFLASDKEKKTNRKIIYADCKKVSEEYKWTCPFDFMITVYEPNCLDLSRKQMEILIMHELHHVGIDTEGIEPTFYVVPHDVEEFDTIIERFGLHWEEKTCQEETIQTAERI